MPDEKPIENKPDHAKDIADLKAQNAALLTRLDALTAKPPEKKEELDLSEKSKLEREAADKKSGDTKALESALKFSLNSPEFLKTNASLLPKDVADIFKTADKETYDDAVQKASAIKAGIIQSFFSVQSNLDLLTPGLKTTLEDYLKLTKNGKQERAQTIYDSVFEPAFEMLKRVKKAEQLNNGFANGNGLEDAYKNKMIGLSKKYHLGEKENA